MDRLTAIEEFVKKLKAEPAPMLMFCPRCSKQHIDAPKGEWMNPPHATHTCQFCGLLWRPSNENTTGVKEIQQLEPKHAERIAASFPLSQEAVRDEVLEAATKACERHLYGTDEFQHGVRTCIEAVVALKREPNAAAESYESAHPKALDEPAPAAPDVCPCCHQALAYCSLPLPPGASDE